MTVRIDIQIVPARPPGVSPDAWHVPMDCGARTTLVLRDQQIGVLSGFPEAGGDNDGVLTTITPYIIWEDMDLKRLLECKRAKTTNALGPHAAPARREK